VSTLIPSPDFSSYVRRGPSGRVEGVFPGHPEPHALMHSAHPMSRSKLTLEQILEAQICPPRPHLYRPADGLQINNLTRNTSFSLQMGFESSVRAKFMFSASVWRGCALRESTVG